MNMGKSSLLLSCLLLLSGCGDPPVSHEQNDQYGQLKAGLQVVATHGTGESALQPIVMGIQELDASNPAKQDLEKKQKELMSATSADQRKQIAQEMLKVIDHSANSPGPASK